MAKNGIYNGQVAEALRVLDRPHRADKTSLVRALSQVRGAGVVSDAELLERYGKSEYFAVDASLGRLVVAVETKEATTSQWLSQAHATAKKLALPVATYDDRWQDWKLPQTPNRSRQGLGNELRGKTSVAHKLGVVTLQPMVRLATLASTEHVDSRSGPYPSYKNAHQTLEVQSAQRGLVTSNGFRETLAPEYDHDKQLLEVYADSDATLIRSRRFMGNYIRDARVLNRSKHAQLQTTQSLSLMQQTVFSLTPEDGSLLFDNRTAGAFEQIEDDRTKSDIYELMQSEEIVPLGSSLHVSQRHEILQTRPA